MGHGLGADILNLSIGTSYYDENIDTIFQLLVDRGVAPVVAIDNESLGSSRCPGNAAQALSVGAIELMDGSRDVAPFSSGCSLDFPGTGQSRVVKPDVVAPGRDVYSCVPPSAPDQPGEYRFMDGTSMATPHLSGILAVLMSAQPDIPLRTIFDALRHSANHPKGAEYRPDNRWGYGCVDPCAALAVLDQNSTT